LPPSEWRRASLRSSFERRSCGSAPSRFALAPSPFVGSLARPGRFPLRAGASREPHLAAYPLTRSNSRFTATISFVSRERTLAAQVIRSNSSPASFLESIGRASQHVAVAATNLVTLDCNSHKFVRSATFSSSRLRLQHAPLEELSRRDGLRQRSGTRDAPIKLTEQFDAAVTGATRAPESAATTRPIGSGFCGRDRARERGGR
jgi:hypothetical protein